MFRGRVYNKEERIKLYDEMLEFRDWVFEMRKGKVYFCAPKLKIMAGVCREIDDIEERFGINPEVVDKHVREACKQGFIDWKVVEWRMEDEKHERECRSSKDWAIFFKEKDDREQKKALEEEGKKLRKTNQVRKITSYFKKAKRVR